MSDNFDKTIEDMFNEMLAAEQDQRRCDALAKQFAEEAKVAGNYALECKMHIQRLMGEANKKTTETTHHKLERRVSTKVVIRDQAVLPLEYYTQVAPPKPTPDKVLIKKFLKDGHPVPGVEIEKSEYLLITAKG